MQMLPNKIMVHVDVDVDVDVDTEGVDKETSKGTRTLYPYLGSAKFGVPERSVPRVL